MGGGWGFVQQIQIVFVRDNTEDNRRIASILGKYIIIKIYQTKYQLSCLMFIIS